MRFVIELKKEDMDRIQALAKQGKYESVQQFLEVSLSNQLYLEKTANLGVESEVHAVSRISPNYEASAGGHLDRRPKESITIVEPPAAPKLYLDEPLWGLTNRIFPIKISLRVLSNMLSDSDKFVSLKEFAENAFHEACVVGAKLDRIDKRAKRQRGEKLSESLPTNPNDYKSRKRFESQFVGRITFETGKIGGALGRLKMVDMVGDNTPDIQVGITYAGREFALLENPILDRREYEKSLSDEEISFYLEHIISELPGETKAMYSLLKDISEGKTEPENLSKTVCSLFGYSPVAGNTVRVGLTSRMVEAGLIARKKHGTKVNYHLTDHGKSIMKTIASRQGQIHEEVKNWLK